MSTRTRRSSPKKHYCWTINNPTKEDEDLVIDFAEHEWCAYLVYQHEVGERGTYHFQGYLALTTKKRYTQLREWFPRAAFMPSRGNPKQNLKYCTKDESRATEAQWREHFAITGDEEPLTGPFEYGEIPRKAGSRSDLLSACEKIKNGAKIIDIADEDLVVVARHSRGLKELQFWYMQRLGMKIRDNIEVILLNGPTGSGKSTKGHELAMEDPDGWFPLTSTKKNTLWFDGYQGENTLLMDEFRPTWCTHSTLLKILDKFPFRLPIKGNHSWALWTRVIITTTHPVGKWYDLKDTATGELYRRITDIRVLEPRLETGLDPGSEVGGNIDPHQVEPYGEALAPPESGVMTA